MRLWPAYLRHCARRTDCALHILIGSLVGRHCAWNLKMPVSNAIANINHAILATVSPIVQNSMQTDDTAFRA
jgi:hypothetical protein